MLPRRCAAGFVFLLSASYAAAQGGPQLFTVTPPGAKIGSTVEITVAGAAIDHAESLLFSDPKVKAEIVGDTAVAVVPKDKKAPGGTAKGKMAAPKATGAVKFNVTVPAGVPAGVLDVRVVTKSGLSNPRAFVVGNLAEVAEKEPNNDVPEAQKIDLETTVNGVIATPTDVDYVKFTARAGQSVVVSCLTTAVDSKLPADLMIATIDGKPLAAGRGYRGGDVVADFTAPADGEYLVRLSSFAYVSGGTDHFYRLNVTTKPWADAVYPPVLPDSRTPVTVSGRNLPGSKLDSRFLRANGKPLEALTIASPGPLPARRDVLNTDQVVPPSGGFVDGTDLTLPGVDFVGGKPFVLFPQSVVVVDAGDNDAPEKAQAIAVPCDVAGRIEKRGDRDWYAFDAKKGDVLTFEMFADRIGSPVDSYFLLTDEKGKVIVEADDTADTLSPNQFYTRAEDPSRYRFTAPADGKYRVMASTRESAIQFGVRDVYLLRIAKAKPDFRLAVVPYTIHLPEGITVPKGGSEMLSVYVGRQDGYDGPITLTVDSLPAGVTCPPQVVGPQQTRAVLVLSAAADAKDWTGFLSIKGAAEIDGAKVEHAARPFAAQWPMAVGNNGQPPNTPMLVRLDRGPGLAAAVRGEALFSVAATGTQPFKAKAGEKVEVPVKLTRKADVKDAVQLFYATPLPGPQKPTPAPVALATIEAGKTDGKVSVEIPATLAAGTYTIVFQAVIPDPASKPNAIKPPKAAYPTLPITIEVAAKEVPPKKKK